MLHDVVMGHNVIQQENLPLLLSLAIRVKVRSAE